MTPAASIDHHPMSNFQLTAIAVCMIINMLDGFDVLVVAFTAPSIAAEWGLSATAIGTLLSAGLVGMTIGSLVLGPLADRFGRRPLVLCCLVVISMGMLLSALCQNAQQLAFMRLLTGMGIGGMLPTLNTVVAELSSIRWRSFAISVLQAGYPVGATLGGIIAAVLISQYSWRAVYAAAGLCSTLMIVVAWRQLPESLDFLVTRQPRDALPRINRLLCKLGRPAMVAIPPRSGATPAARSAYAELFTTPGLVATTTLLCVAFFIVMLSFYFVLSWTPKLLVDAGMSTSQGISGGVLLNVGGVVGSLLLGYVSSRIDISKLIALYMIATAAFMMLFSQVAAFDAGMLLLALCLGFFIFGSMVGLYALSPNLFPTSCRTAGLSVAIGLGRVGGVLSPLVAGYLFDHGWERQEGYILFAVPLLLAAVLVLSLSVRRR